jgi:hypothetical protein
MTSERSHAQGITRAEHIAWCKQRALEYLDRGDLQGAFTSMLSDLRKHPGTENHIGGILGVSLLFAIRARLIHDPAEMRKWIEGFN